MAVKMVRQPSETPNITNIDDIIGLRYAYANQNGYVIGRGLLGTGIDTDAYTISGNTFTVNSGRLVLQGVESDVETNGHSIIIDISATKKYYAVYLEVNLSTNTSDILIKSDTVGIPNIEAGDDLTVYTNGIAKMVLFTFEATNGVISNVVKVVKECKYAMLYNTDENGILKFGDIIIPQKKLIASNLSDSTQIELTNYLTNAGISLNSNFKLQIDLTNYASSTFTFQATGNQIKTNVVDVTYYSGEGLGITELYVYKTTSRIYANLTRYINSNGTPQNISISNIYLIKE